GPSLRESGRAALDERRERDLREERAGVLDDLARNAEDAVGAAHPASERRGKDPAVGQRAGQLVELECRATAHVVADGLRDRDAALDRHAVPVRRERGLVEVQQDRERLTAAHRRVNAGEQRHRQEAARRKVGHLDWRRGRGAGLRRRALDDLEVRKPGRRGGARAARRRGLTRLWPVLAGQDAPDDEREERDEREADARALPDEDPETPENLAVHSGTRTR